VELTGIKGARWGLLFHLFASIGVIVTIIFVVRKSLTINYANSVSLYATFFLILGLGWAAYLGLTKTAIMLLEARDVQISNGTITVSHLHLGERQYKLIPNHIKKTKVQILRFRHAEPMWLLRFNGWHFAVVPIDWENPLEREAANTNQ